MALDTLDTQAPRACDDVCERASVAGVIEILFRLLESACRYWLYSSVAKEW